MSTEREARAIAPAWAPWVFGTVALLGVALYYAETWDSLDRFAGDIDHIAKIFNDFTGVYHAQGQQVLTRKEPVAGYFYSAFFAVLLSLLAPLSLQAALWVWGGLQAATTALLAAVPRRRLLGLGPWETAVYLVLFATSLPVLHNFKWGQVSVFVTLCVIASLWAYHARRPVAAGVLLALGISIKYYPALFLVYFVLKRDVRFLVACAVATLACFVVVPALLLGPVEWWRFQHGAAGAIADQPWIARDVNSQYFPHVARRLLAPSGLELGPAGVAGLAWIGRFVVVFHVGLVWLLQRRAAREELALSAALLFLSLPFVVETSWPHYFVYLPFCQALLWKVWSRGAGDALPGVPALLLAGSVLFSSIFFFNAFPHWSAYSRRGFLFASNALLLGVAYAVVLPSGRKGDPAGAPSGLDEAR